MSKNFLIITASCVVLIGVMLQISPDLVLRERYQSNSEQAGTGFSFAQAQTASNPRLYIQNRTVNIEIASTSEAQARGLSGREFLPEDQALLFAFSNDGYWAFWMKDMKFPIDMIWLDKDFRVIHMKTNVSPNTYPAAFRPSAPARYVLETRAGFAEKNNLRVSDMLDIR